MRSACLAWSLLLLGSSVQDPAEEIPPSARTAKSADGVDIAFESAGSGSPPIVLVHGWSCDRTYWRSQRDHFSSSHQVVAIDLAGHGESGADRTDWTMAAFGADVRAVLETLDLHGAVLVGHSMGGPVILEAAKQAPERVAALVSVDFFGDVDHPPSAEQLAQLLDSFAADFAGAVGAFARGMFSRHADPELIDRIAADMASASPDVGIPALESTFTYDAAAALRSTKQPLRLINSDFWPTDLAALRRHKPDVELAVMPRVGHFLMLEDPYEFDRLLERAVDELSR